MARILVVDDEKSIREMLEIYLEREGHTVTCASNGVEGLDLCKQHVFDVVVADIKMPNMNGMQLLHKVKELSPETIVIMITAFASFETAKESMDENAYDYITKPFDVDEVKKKIETAIRKKQTDAPSSAETATDTIPGADLSFDMIGRSKQVKKVFDLIPRAAASKSNVLITGESGTGKELVARAIHYNSTRADKPFVIINCGGIPDTLLESELFGYKKGAFTGAAKDKKGLLEASDTGTLFLDEVAELPLSLQVKLLRMVQEKTFTPVGGTDELRSDVRIISATNKNLEEKVMDGSFREDLYYRLNVINIIIPPLRERKEDIPLLARHFLNKYAREMEKDVSDISSFAMDCLMQYQFPGNVRELENIIERGVALAKTSIMLPESLELSRFKNNRVARETIHPADAASGLDEMNGSLDDIMAVHEKHYISLALKRTHGSIKKAAGLLGISFRSMRYRLEKLGIDATAFK